MRSLVIWANVHAILSPSPPSQLNLFPPSEQKWEKELNMAKGCVSYSFMISIQIQMNHIFIWFTRLHFTNELRLWMCAVLACISCYICSICTMHNTQNKPEWHQNVQYLCILTFRFLCNKSPFIFSTLFKSLFDQTALRRTLRHKREDIITQKFHSDISLHHLLNLTCNVMRSSDNVEAFIIVIISRLKAIYIHCTFCSKEHF